MSQLERFLSGQVERKFPINLEEESRKIKYPQTCSAECPHRTCGYHTLENYGKPCQMQWEPKENKNMPLQSKPNPNESLLRAIEIAVAKILKPYHDRLDAIEARDRQPINRSLNGTNPKQYSSLAIGTNQEKIRYD